MPLISIVVPCYNAKNWIQETLESVLTQDVGDMEIIVVDDGSTDGSGDIVKDEFPFVRLIRAERSGPSKARNLGTKESKGEFIQYLDADDLLAPGKLKVQLEAIQNSGADIAYGDWQKLVKTTDNKYIKGGVIGRELKNPEVDLFNSWNPVNVYLFKRIIVEKIGGWNERLSIIQDARFSLDCALRGARFVYCPGVMAYYRIHSSGSVSTRDPIKFVQECFKNACEIEEYLTRRGSINKSYRKALLRAYGYVARASFKKDKPTFEMAYRALKRLSHRYIPENPRHLRLASQLFGYRNAEYIAVWYRKMKAILKHIKKNIST